MFIFVDILSSSQSMPELLFFTMISHHCPGAQGAENNYSFPEFFMRLFAISAAFRRLYLFIFPDIFPGKTNERHSNCTFFIPGHI